MRWWAPSRPSWPARARRCWRSARGPSSPPRTCRFRRRWSFWPPSCRSTPWPRTPRRASPPSWRSGLRTGKTAEPSSRGGRCPGRRRGEEVQLEQRLSVHPELVRLHPPVQVRARHPPRLAHLAQQLALLDLRARFHADAREVEVGGVEASAVVDDDRVARAVVVARHHHHAHVGGVHGRAGIPIDVRAEVLALELAVEGALVAVGRGEAVLARPGEVLGEEERTERLGKGRGEGGPVRGHPGLHRLGRLDVFARHAQLPVRVARVHHLQRAGQGHGRVSIRREAQHLHLGGARRLLHGKSGDGLPAARGLVEAQRPPSQRSGGGSVQAPHRDEHGIPGLGRAGLDGEARLRLGAPGQQAECHQEQAQGRGPAAGRDDRRHAGTFYTGKPRAPLTRRAPRVLALLPGSVRGLDGQLPHSQVPRAWKAFVHHSDFVWSRSERPGGEQGLATFREPGRLPTFWLGLLQPGG
ncbi:hypothetical protein STIAU_4847 [Stigmatella aurantiaca DW4/3-1]|uniref:Uncharacterized protein n=1 Tax=Stigmatella aurantiaca (strain DW4/3-1) TaxID=378806 RepID=Q08PG2_STIAD|nr:hypothetical protein STIAU_4847 [Stigmatella aurantiaca DW4/3-1]